MQRLRGSPGWIAMVAVLFAAGLFLSACGGGGGGGGGGTAPTVSDNGPGQDNQQDSQPETQNPFSGLAKLVGTVSLDGLSSADKAALGSGNTAGRAAARSLAAVDPQNAFVKLYVLDENGNLKDTGLDGDLKSDGSFVVDGVKDGVNYIVRYVQRTTTGKVLELKSRAYVPPMGSGGGTGVPEVRVEVAPETTVIVEAIVSAVLEATEGTGISDEVVAKIADAVEQTVKSLIEKKVIALPSSFVVDAPAQDLQELETARVENKRLTDAAGQILATDDVAASMNVLKAEVQFGAPGESATDEEKAALVKRVFRQLIGGGGVPDFFVRFFADLYVQGVTATPAKLLGAVSAGLGGADTSGDLDEFKATLARAYDLLGKTEKTESEKRELAEIPPIVFGLFPAPQAESDVDWSTDLAEDTDLSVPQGIALVVFSVDEHETDETPFDPFASGSLMDLFHFWGVVDRYAGPDVFDLWVYPGTVWIEQTNDQGDPAGGQDVDALSAGACVGDVEKMMMSASSPASSEGGSVDPWAGVTAKLKYPKRDGSFGVVELVPEASLPEAKNDFPFGPCFVIDPWREGTKSQEGDWWEPNLERVVSDFDSGTYTVRVYDADGTELVSKSFERKVIVGMRDARAKLITPREFPEFPGPNASPEEQDAFDRATQEYFRTGGDTHFAANACVDETAPCTEPDGAKVTVSWDPPEVTLPDGVKLAYEIEVGRNVCESGSTGPCQWNMIYSTWDRDRNIYATSFTLPVVLPKTDPGEEPYELNVRVEFVDARTGDHLGEGGWSHARFYVGDPVDPDATFAIVGKVTGEDPSAPGDRAPGPKVALFWERWNPEAETNEMGTLAVSDVADDGTYKLEPTIGSFFKAPAGAWFGVVAFWDEDRNGGYNEVSDPGGWTYREYSAWPDWNQSIWFDTWGGVVKVNTDVCATDGSGCKHSEVVVVGGETVKGPNFTLGGVAIPGSAGGQDWASYDDDGDGLTNGDEQTLGTDPWNWDSDWDGCPDGSEVDATGGDPLDPNLVPENCGVAGSPTAPADGVALYQATCSVCHGNLDSTTVQDRSVEGITGAIGGVSEMASLTWLTLADVQAIADALNGGAAPGVGGGSVPGTPGDRDGDGIADDQDNCPDAYNPGQEDVNGNLIGDACEEVAPPGGQPGTPDMGPDTDKDGLPDAVETNTGVFVDMNDTGTDPANPDTDGDLIADGIEVWMRQDGFDPNDPNVPVTSVPTSEEALVGTWVARDPEGNLLSTVVLRADGTYTSDWTDMGTTYHEEGTWSVMPDGTVEATISSTEDPEDRRLVGIPQTVSVVLLDDGRVVFDLDGLMEPATP